MRDSEELLQRIAGGVGDRDMPTSSAHCFGVPNGKTYRWIVPQDKTATLKVLSSWRPYNLFSRLKWQALRTLIDIFGVEHTPGLNAIGQLPSFDSSVIGNLVGLDMKDTIAVFYIGTPGPQRKAVCHLVSKSGDIIAILKIPLESAARAAIMREAKVLEELHQCDPNLTVPRLLGIDEARGTSAQTWLDGLPVGRSFTPAHRTLLITLQGSGRFELGKHVALLRKQAEQAAAVLPDMSRLMASIDSIDANLMGPRVWQHGDFSPWNLRKRGQTISLFDWEDGTRDGLPVWDMAHYFAIQSHLFESKPKPFDAMQRGGYFSSYLAEMSLTQAQGETLFKTYCLAQGVASCAGGNVEFGRFLFQCSDWDMTL